VFWQAFQACFTGSVLASVVLDFLTLSNKHNIHKFLLNIKLIRTPCETGLKSLPKHSLWNRPEKLAKTLPVKQAILFEKSRNKRRSNCFQ
jgi:hypothetical protein